MSYQKITILGNIGKIEQRFTQGGDSIVNFSVAVNEKYKKKDGAQVERVEWFNCLSFGKQSEIIYQYFQKGNQILVSGTMNTRDWLDKEGNKRYNTDLKVAEFSFVDRKDSAPQNNQQQTQPAGPQGGQKYQQAGQTQKPQQQNRPAPPPPNQPQGTFIQEPTGEFIDDQDIPF